MSDTPTPAPAEQNTEPTGDGGEKAASGPARETDNATMAELRILRKQLKEREQRLNSYETAAAEKAKAELSEVERLKAERDEARTQAEQTRAEVANERKANALRLAALKAGAHNPESLLRLADLSTIDLDGGTVTGVDAVIKGFLKSDPYLFGSSTPPATGSGGGNPSGGAPSVSPADISKMSRAEFNELEGKLARGEIKL